MNSHSRGPPKKKKKEVAPMSTETSIVPVGNMLPRTMQFPDLPLAAIAPTCGKKRKSTSTKTSFVPSVASVR